MRFKSHINDILLKFNRAMSPLYSIASQIPRNTLLTIYKVYAQPHLDYCASVYDGHLTVFDRSRLEKAQKRAARLITGTPRRTSTDGLLEELGWSTLANRRLTNKLLLCQKLRFDNSVPGYIKDMIPNTRAKDTVRELRSTKNDTITLPPAHTHGYFRSFIPSTTKLWNEMPSGLRQISANSLQFKKHLMQARSPKPANPFFSIGSKKGNALHTQLRLKSSHLNSHMYAQGKANSPSCSCGYPREDTQHFLITCPLYNLARTALFGNLSSILNRNFSRLSIAQKIKIMIKGPDGGTLTRKTVAIAVQGFLLETQRL